MSTRIWIALVCTAMLVAAGGCGKSPGSVTAEFETDWGTGKYADAEKLMSRSTASDFEQTATAAGGKDALIALLEQARQAEGNKAVAKTEVTAYTVVDTQAIAHFKTTDGAGTTSDEREMNLVKEDGQWKVNFDRFKPWNRVPGVPRVDGGGGGGGPGGGPGGGAGGGAGGGRGQNRGRGRQGGTTQSTDGPPGGG